MNHFNGFAGEMLWWRDKPDFADFRFSPSGQYGLTIKLLEEDSLVSRSLSSLHIQLIDLLEIRRLNIDFLGTNSTEYTSNTEIKTSANIKYLNYYWINETTIGIIESGEADFHQRIMELDHEGKIATNMETYIYPHNGGKTQDSSRGYPIFFNGGVYLVYSCYPFPYLPLLVLIPWLPSANTILQKITAHPVNATHIFGDPIVYGRKIFFKLFVWDVHGNFHFSADILRSIDLDQKKRLKMEDFETVMLDESRGQGVHIIQQYQGGPSGRYLMLYVFKEAAAVQKKLFVIDLKMSTVKKIIMPVRAQEINNRFSVLSNRIIRIFDNADDTVRIRVYQRVITKGVPDLTELCINNIIFNTNIIINKLPLNIARIMFPPIP